MGRSYNDIVAMLLDANNYVVYTIAYYYHDISQTTFHKTTCGQQCRFAYILCRL